MTSPSWFSYAAISIEIFPADGSNLSLILLICSLLKSAQAVLQLHKLNLFSLDIETLSPDIILCFNVTNSAHLENIKL